MQEKLTIKEALEHGYTHCGYETREDQQLMKISELDQYQIEELEWAIDHKSNRVMLADKEPIHYQMPYNQLSDMVFDHICNQTEVGDEDNELAVMVIDQVNFIPVTEAINEVLRKKPYYKLTNIQLIP